VTYRPYPRANRALPPVILSDEWVLPIGQPKPPTRLARLGRWLGQALQDINDGWTNFRW
jgi:hypothetical protein